jgi:hypothetical protein
VWIRDHTDTNDHADAYDHDYADAHDHDHAHAHYHHDHTHAHYHHDHIHANYNHDHTHANCAAVRDSVSELCAGILLPTHSDGDVQWRLLVCRRVDWQEFW